MATFDITVPAGSGVGQGGGAASVFSTPGDFDGATITDVLVVGSPTITSDQGGTDDTIGIRWRIQTDGDVAIFGDFNANINAVCAAELGSSLPTSAPIFVGSSPAPAQNPAVAADWDEIAYEVNYAANMMADGETCSWASFTIRVTYTPVLFEVTQFSYRFATPITGDDHVQWPLVGTLDTSFEITLDVDYAIIIKIGNDNTQSPVVLWQLEYNVDGAGWNVVNGSSSNVRSTNSGAMDTESDGITERLTITSRNYGISKLDEVDGNINQTVGSDFDYEWYYAIVFRSAELSGGEEIEFRVTSDDTVVYDITPTATVPGGGPVLVVGTITATGDVAAAGFSQNDALGTSTLLGTVIADGVQLARGTITALGEGISEATHLAFATITLTGDCAVGGGTQFILGTSTFIGEVISGGGLLPIAAFGTITMTGDVVTGGGQHIAAGTITLTGDVVGNGAIRAFGTSTFIGDVVSTATAIKFALGTIVLTGDCIATGTHILNEVITILGEGISEGIHNAFAVTTYIGELQAGGGAIRAFGTITVIGDVAATATGIVLPTGTITATGDLVAAGLHGGFAETITFIGEVIAVGQSLGGLQSALGTITVFGENTSEGTHRAFGTSTFIGDLAAIGADVSAIEAVGTITLTGDVVADGVSRAFGTITITGDVVAAGFSQNDATGTSSFIGQSVSRGTSLARATITVLGEGISEGTHSVSGTISIAGDLVAGGGTLFALGTSTFIGDVAAVGSGFKFPTATITITGQIAATHKSLIFGTSTILGDLVAAGYSQVDAVATITAIGEVNSIGTNTSGVNAVGTITDSGEVAASGTHLAGGAIVTSGQVAAVGSTLTRFATATITIFGLSASIGTKTAFGTITLTGDLASLGQSLLPVPAEIMLFRGTVDAFPTVVCFIEAKGSILLTGNIRTADMFISNHRDGTLGVKPHKVSFTSIFGSLSAPALHHILDDGNHVAQATITVKGSLDVIMIEESCIAPKAEIRLTSFMHADDGVFILGTRIARGTVLITGDMPSVAASLPHAGLTNITSFMSARGRIIPEGNMSLLSQIAQLDFSGMIGPATIDGQKQAIIQTSYGSIELYNNSQGAFYSIGGGGTIKEAFTTIIYAGTLIARGRKDQTQFGKGIILITGNFLDDGGDPKGIHINNLATIGLSGTVGAHGSILGMGTFIVTSQLDVGGGTHIQRATTLFRGLITQAKPKVFHFARATSTFKGSMAVSGGLHLRNLATINLAGNLLANGDQIIKNAFATITMTGTCAASGLKRPLSLSVLPSSLVSVVVNCPVTTGAATGTARGGKAPYTYQWTRISGPALTINSPTSRITTFTRNSAGRGFTIFQLVVTDFDSDTAGDSVSVETECGT